MTSVGSGALVGLTLMVVFRLTPHRVVGTDVLHAAPMLWPQAWRIRPWATSTWG